MADTKNQLLERALEYATKMHEGTSRKSDPSVPYIVHPIDVEKKLVASGVTDPEIRAAALLHDTIEDCAEKGASYEDILARFGKRVADLVQEVTDDKTLGKAERKRGQLAHAAHKSEGAAQIKMADKWSNLEDLCKAPPKGWGAARIQGYFVWAWFVLQPMRKYNKRLSDALDEVFAGHFVADGCVCPTLPPSKYRDAALERYLASMESCAS